ncbi:MAG: ABC transporter permease [Chloroflexi bacterium]|nr:ABC transporter permease [Chloroflexota bacterium]
MLIVTIKGLGLRAKLVELWRYRELIMNLTVRDLKARYKNSVLGIGWSLFNPLLMMLVFTLVYTVMLGQSNRHDYPAFILSGLLPWNFFSASIMGSTGSIVGNAHLIKKVYFPREVLPLSILLSNLVNFLIAIPVYVVLALLLGSQLTLWVAWLPVVILVQMIFALGVSFILSAANAFYRDVQQIMDVVILAWFFLTPVIWDVNMLPVSKTVWGIDLPIQRLTYILNPMASIIAAYRDVLYYGRPIGADFFLRTAVTAIIVLLIGFAVFHRLSGRFAEEV